MRQNAGGAYDAGDDCGKIAAVAAGDTGKPGPNDGGTVQPANRAGSGEKWARAGWRRYPRTDRVVRNDIGYCLAGHPAKAGGIRARAEFQKQLLDKFGSGRELSEFLETKESQRFLNELWSQGAGRTNRVLRALQNGIVLTMLGLGFLALSHMRRGFVTPGVLVLSLGVGFLLSAVIAHQLSKKLGGSGDAGPDDASLSRT